MGRTLDLSDDVYTRLRRLAQWRGLDAVEVLIEELLREAEIQRRQELGKRIDTHREEMLAKYGVMADSTELIRDDRER